MKKVEVIEVYSETNNPNEADCFDWRKRFKRIAVLANSEVLYLHHGNYIEKTIITAKELKELKESLK